MRAINDRPYERTGAWAGLPWGGAGMGGFYAASQRPLIRLPIRADTFPSRGRLGALPRQRKDLGAGVDGEVTTPQSASLTAPLTRGSEPSAASGRKSEVSEWQRSADEEGA